MNEANLFIKRALRRIQIRKWRKTNPERYLELNRKHQLTWREANVKLNRERAKYGMRALNMFRDLVKLERRG